MLASRCPQFLPLSSIHLTLQVPPLSPPGPTAGLIIQVKPEGAGCLPTFLLYPFYRLEN